MLNLLSHSVFSYSKNHQKTNDDAVLPIIKSGDYFILAIADGVGSQTGSNQASELALNILRENFNFNEFNAEKTLEHIKSNIESLSNQVGKELATTLTFVVVGNSQIRVVHIGDSRLYIKKGNKLSQITIDHTQYQKLLDEKLYTKKELSTMSVKHILTTALAPNVNIEYQEEILDIKDFLDENNCLILHLMTDGAYHFWEKRPTFSKQTMDNPIAFANGLLRRINKNGAIDDYSLISAKFYIET